MKKILVNTKGGKKRSSEEPNKKGIRQIENSKTAGLNPTV